KDIWVAYKKEPTQQLRNILMENYLHLVRYNAERIHVKLPDEVELDDLMSAGIFGLMDAIDAFDMDRGVKFETYCAPRIRGAILDVLEDKKGADPVREIQRKDLKDLLTKGLSRAERLIIILYYFEEMTMKEIGATLDLSESRVSQMHSSILARLKAQMQDKKKEFQQAAAV